MEFGAKTRRYQKSAVPGMPRRAMALAAHLVAGLGLACSVQAQQLASLDPTLAPMSTAVPAARISEAVIQAREAYDRKQQAKLDTALQAAQGDPLQIYVEYWWLRSRLAQRAPLPEEQASEFLKRYPGTFLADRILRDWVLAEVRLGNYSKALQLDVHQVNDAQVQCARIEAAQATGQAVNASEALAAHRPGNACWSMMNRLVSAGIVQNAHLTTLLRDAIEVNELPQARRYARYLFDAERLKTYDAILKEPMQWLALQPRPAASALDRELVLIALTRLARKDRDVGDTYLRDQWAAHLPKTDLAWLRSQFALIAALNLDPRAHDWYREAGLEARIAPYNQAWRVRAALRQPTIDWGWVMGAIDAMPADEREADNWIYWRARGQAAQGQTQAAQAAYARIADRFGFYGQLAAEELGRTIAPPQRAAPVSPQELAEAQSHPGLRRAVSLFHQGWRREAVPEWNFSLRGMNDRQLLAAAEYARQEGIYDRVVNTSELTQGQFDFNQRYIAPFEGRVTAQARQIDLDPAWVYGLIRQESRFVSNARSTVGASGLMQLMPATARWVARKIGMSDFHPSKVNDFDVNTLLGTNYLNMVLTDLGGSQVLASAGYNAGPGRSVRWRASLTHRVEGAIFAETIPFTETRDYVQKVLSNAVYYAALFSGQPQSLKTRLGYIEPSTQTTVALP